MKTNFQRILACAVFAASLLAAPAGAKSVKVTISKTDDSVITGFVVTGDANSLVISQVPTAASGARFPQNQIKSIYWDEPEDWKAAWKLWTRRDYVAAGKAFQQLVKTYANLAQIEDSYGAKAMYYQLECLRRSGEYSKLMDSLDGLLTVKLSSGYSRQIQLFNYWGHVGKKLWEPLKIITDKFEMAESSIPTHTVPPTTLPLKKIDASLMIQIAYMRGIATEKLARKEYKAALEAVNPEVPETRRAVDAAWAKVRASMTDYSRVFTLTYMSERLLAKQAMVNCMAILKDDPGIKDNYQMQKEVYALASFYKDLFGKGKVPSGYDAFLKEPKPPEGAMKFEEKGGGAANPPAKKEVTPKKDAAAEEKAPAKVEKKAKTAKKETAK